MKSFDLDESLPYIIRKTSLGFQNWFKRNAKKHDLDITTEQWTALCRLWDREGQSQRELNEKLPQGIANTSRLLDGMEKRGLVTRKADPNDRRVSRIFLTDEGRALKDRLVPIGENGINLILQVCSDEEMEMVKSILNKICQKINHADD